MSLKAHIVLGTLLGVLLGAGAVTVLSDSTPRAEASAEASDSAPTKVPEVSGSPAASRMELHTDGLSRPMRPGAVRRSLQS